ncbi:MBL fold metallo-hydrolase [Yersinia enterocolitica]|nr:MBL fold metallo-hydrolase [Yersinia enterocolitica]
MSITIRFLKAHHGDSILITLDNSSVEERLLIDGGPRYTFRPRKTSYLNDGNLRKTLDELIENNKCIDLVILTHVDDDHIGGLIQAFEDLDYLPKLAKKVLFNSGQLIHEHFAVPTDPLKDIRGNFNQSNNTSIGQGITFEKYITECNIWDRRLIKQLDYYPLKNGNLIFLTPNISKLEKLLEKWEEEQVDPFTSNTKNDWSESYQNLIKSDVFIEDKSPTNGSSLSFILKIDTYNFVFLGDAHPSTIIEGLNKLGHDENNPLKANLVKISHHGSKANTNNELLKILHSDIYVISTDSSLHGLPDKTTLARIHQHHPEANIYFNYDDVITRVFSDEEIETLDGKLRYSKEDFYFA